MLPPRHSVTLYPSSVSSPVNSRLTPPSLEPHAAWILKHPVSSSIMVPKCRVFSPVDEVRVLFIQDELIRQSDPTSKTTVHGEKTKRKQVEANQDRGKAESEHVKKSMVNEIKLSRCTLHELRAVFSGVSPRNQISPSALPLNRVGTP